jgi:hypothetical protein
LEIVNSNDFGGSLIDPARFWFIRPLGLARLQGPEDQAVELALDAPASGDLDRPSALTSNDKFFDCKQMIGVDPMQAGSTLVQPEANDAPPDRRVCVLERFEIEFLTAADLRMDLRGDLMQMLIVIRDQRGGPQERVIELRVEALQEGP